MFPPVDLQTITVNFRAWIEARNRLSPTNSYLRPLYIPVPVTWIERLLRLLERRADASVRTVRNHDDLHELLLRLWEYMDDHADVNDGADGPIPNRALSFTQEIDSAIEFVLREKPR